jgi:hypothetical protein
MRWVLAALVVLSSTTVAACGGGDEDLAASTPSPTVDVPGSQDGNVPPPTTRSPSAEVLFEWAEFEDQESGVSAALPDGAEPVASPITGPDGQTITTRGHVHEHAGGVIGFELIDEFATGDDLTKLAELLAASVAGTVRSTAPATLTRGTGLDGEIAYGDDEVMLFRIVVLNERGDVWNGFVGGPAADRGRLESEFGRLTVSADLRAAFDWVTVTDEPSGIAARLPGPVAAPAERRLTLADGSTLMTREYQHHDSSTGFVVIETGPDAYDLDDVAAARAKSVGGTVESSAPIQLDGRDAVEAVIADGAWRSAERIIALDGHVVLVYSGNRVEGLADGLDVVGWLSDSVAVP